MPHPFGTSNNLPLNGGEDYTSAPDTAPRLVKRGGRPKGSSNLKSKQPSAIARAFLKAGLDWRIDFAQAIKNNKRERIKLWLRLLPYLITTGSRVKVKTWKGKASRAALVALDALEQSTND